MGFLFAKKLKNHCVLEYHGIKDQLGFQWNTDWHHLMWDPLLHGVVTLQLLSVSRELGSSPVFYCFISDLVGKEKVSSDNFIN